ncbi:DUF883 family protein [Undibacterium sp. Ji49W]|uniref:DUF883 family protein n=1 Tax=Undibacterium sp. Ji49W TaxID=3413040 RepID=UPI003BF05ABB
MLESNIKAVNKDIKVLLKDAQALFSAAATLSGEKADEARARGMKLLDAAMVAAQDAQASALATGKEMVNSTDAYVKENPWSSIGVAATAGLLVGLLCCRKS